jgi:DNA-nicking Smr family endonuclease
VTEWKSLLRRIRPNFKLAFSESGSITPQSSDEDVTWALVRLAEYLQSEHNRDRVQAAVQYNLHDQLDIFLEKSNQLRFRRCEASQH